jgi:hypothetical protein
MALLPTNTFILGAVDGYGTTSRSLKRPKKLGLPFVYVMNRNTLVMVRTV